MPRASPSPLPTCLLALRSPSPPRSLSPRSLSAFPSPERRHGTAVVTHAAPATASHRLRAKKDCLDLLFLPDESPEQERLCIVPYVAASPTASASAALLSSRAATVCLYTPRPALMRLSTTTFPTTAPCQSNQMSKPRSQMPPLMPTTTWRPPTTRSS
ncbi:uncharacterized protein LOC125549053 [Triticum urartu]|nr:uncharacterized protein LOC125549053 [Triticum urartu]